MTNLEIAQTFGRSLDQDDFDTTRTVLSANCEYIIGNEVLLGPEAITGSYEANMIAGRKKLDKLEWGECRIEPLGNDQYFVHFTDYLEHQSKPYTHRCKQRLTVKDGLIAKIEHIDDLEESARLKAYYASVGLN